MASPRSKRHKQRGREVSEAMDAFSKRVTDEGFQDKGLKLVKNPRGKEKMSAIFFEFLKPYMQHATTEEAFQQLVMIGLVAWNSATFQDKEREKSIKEFVKLMPWSTRSDAKAIIREMIARKDEFFPDNNRRILDYQITMTKGGPHLSVVSTLE